MSFVANFIRFPAVGKLWQSVKIWQSYREFTAGNFFETQCSNKHPMRCETQLAWKCLFTTIFRRAILSGK